MAGEISFLIAVSASVLKTFTIKVFLANIMLRFISNNFWESESL